MPIFPSQSPWFELNTSFNKIIWPFLEHFSFVVNFSVKKYTNHFNYNIEKSCNKFFFLPLLFLKLYFLSNILPIKVAIDFWIQENQININYIFLVLCVQWSLLIRWSDGLSNSKFHDRKAYPMAVPYIYIHMQINMCCLRCIHWIVGKDWIKFEPFSTRRCSFVLCIVFQPNDL